MMRLNLFLSHPNSGEWHLTHQPSGAVIARGASAVECLAMAQEEMEREFDRLADWVVHYCGLDDSPRCHLSEAAPRDGA